MSDTHSVGASQTTDRVSPVRRVMIVDDDPAVLRALNELVLEWGFDVVRFSNFEDARAYLASESAEA